MTRLTILSRSCCDEDHSFPVGASLDRIVRTATRSLPGDLRGLLNTIGHNVETIEKAKSMGFDHRALKKAKHDAVGTAQRKKVARVLLNLLKTRGHLEAEARLRPFLPFLLEHRVISLEMRAALKAGLMNMRLVRDYARHDELTMPTPPPPPLGSFGQRETPGFASFRVVERRLAKRLEITSPIPFDRSPYKFTWPFDLPDAEKFQRAELEIRQLRLTGTGVLRCILNGRAAAVLHRTNAATTQWIAVEPALLKAKGNVLVLERKRPGLGDERHSRGHGQEVRQVLRTRHTPRSVGENRRFVVFDQTCFVAQRSFGKRRSMRLAATTMA